MKYTLTVLVIFFLSIITSAQASDNVSNYILQKQIASSKLRQQSETKLVQLRHLPKNSVYLVNITPKFDTGESVTMHPGAKELDAIATASGGKSAKKSADNVAKISTK